MRNHLYLYVHGKSGKSDHGIEVKPFEKLHYTLLATYIQYQNEFSSIDIVYLKDAKPIQTLFPEELEQLLVHHDIKGKCFSKWKTKKIS